MSYASGFIEPPSEPASQSAAAPSTPTDLRQTVRDAATAEGIDPALAERMVEIESNFDASAKNKKSSAGGLYQFTNGTAGQYGLADKNDPKANAAAGARLTRDNIKSLKGALGRDPDNHEVYMAHLLGAGGAGQVLNADANLPLIDVVRQYDGKNADAIVKNNGMDGMTVGEAIEKWRGKFAGTPQAAGGASSGRRNRYQAPDLWGAQGANPEALPEVPAVAEPKAPTEERGPFMRGFTDYAPQLKQAAGGLAAAAGQGLGIDSLRDYGIEKFQAANKELEATQQDTDSLSKAWEGAADPMERLGRLRQWAAYQAGQGVANVLESLVLAGGGALVGSAAAPGVGTLAGAGGALVARKVVKQAIIDQAESVAAKVIEKQIAAGAAEEAAKAAGKKAAENLIFKHVGSSVGAGAGIYGSSIARETGSIYADAHDEAQKTGEQVDLPRVLGSGVVAGALEGLGDKIGIDAMLKGGAGGGIVKRLAKGAVETGLKESATEVPQTAVERFGAKQALGDGEAVRSYIDAAGGAFVGGALPGGAGAATHRGGHAATATPSASTTPLADAQAVQAAGQAPAAPAAPAASTTPTPNAGAPVEAIPAAASTTPAPAEVGTPAPAGGTLADARAAYLGLDAGQPAAEAASAESGTPAKFAATRGQILGYARQRINQLMGEASRDAEQQAELDYLIEHRDNPAAISSAYGIDEVPGLGAMRGNLARATPVASMASQAQQKDSAATAKAVDGMNRAVGSEMFAPFQEPTPAAGAEPDAAAQSRQLARDIGKVFGRKVGFFEHAQDAALKINGAFQRAGGGRILVAADGASKPAHVVMGHELTHALRTEHADLYDALLASVAPKADVDGFVKDWRERHQDSNAKAMSDDDIREEFVADTVADRFGEKEFWNLLAERKPKHFGTLATRVLGAIDKVIAAVTGKSRAAGYLKDVKDLHSVRRTVARAYEEWAARTGEKVDADLKLGTNAKPGDAEILAANKERAQAAVEAKRGGRNPSKSGRLVENLAAAGVVTQAEAKPAVEAKPTAEAKPAPVETQVEPTDEARYPQAVEVVRKNQRASISLIQRHLRIGYNTAARLLERMKAEGVVSATAQDGTLQVLPEKAENKAAAKDNGAAEPAQHDKPMAAAGLTSYRYKGPLGWVMIGAKDHADALREANRSLEKPEAALGNLQVWNGEKYEPATDDNAPTPPKAEKKESAKEKQAPAAKQAGDTVTVNDQPVTLTAEQATAWNAADAKHTSTVAMLERSSLNPDEVAKKKKAAAMERSATRREIAGAQTPKEQAAAAKQASAVTKGKTVEITNEDGSTDTGEVVSNQFGKVKVKLADGDTVTVPHGSVRVVSEFALSRTEDAARTPSELARAIEADHPGVKLDLLGGRGDTLTLSRIVVPKDQRDTGVGTAIMRRIVDYADEAGKTVALTPSKDFGGAVTRLREFYKRFGFVENKGSNKDFAISESMYRPPAERMKFSRDEDYRDEHTAPSREEGAPLSDLTGDGAIYPEDVYSAKGLRYYGTGHTADKAAFALANKVRGNPEAEVTIYRAVPKDVNADINPGDWVAITRQYAEDHGESRFDGDYKILSKMVKAGDIFTNGDSIQEWGYDPADAGGVKFSRADDVAVDERLLDIAQRDTRDANGLFTYDIEEDQQGVLPGKPTAINRALKKGTYTLTEMAAPWDRTRQYLRNAYGDTVTLYRADAPQSERHADTQVVYMGDKALAQKFARNGRKVEAHAIPVGDIIAVNALRSGYYEFIVKKPGEVKFSRAEPTESKAFKAWFGDSKVVDAQGEPLVIYHGTTGDVTEFDMGFSGSDGVGYSAPAIFATSDQNLASDYAQSKYNRDIATALRYLQKYKNENPGVYDDVYEAQYSTVRERFRATEDAGMRETGNGANVMPLYMALKNPIEVDAKGQRFMAVMPDAIREAVDGGHDGAIVRNVIDNASPATNYPADVYVAFSPSQVKSATGNVGTFDVNNPDIRFSRDDKATPLEAATQHVRDMMTTHRKFNFWHRTIGTQFHKAKIHAGFAKVYDGVQSFLADTTRYAMQSEAKAPDLLPKMDSLKDLFTDLKRIGKLSMQDKSLNMDTISRADREKLADAVYRGTLAGTVYSDAELQAKGYDGRQIAQYRQYLAAVNDSLDTLAKSEIAHVLKLSGNEQADSVMKMSVEQAKDFANAALQGDARARLIRFLETTEVNHSPIPRKYIDQYRAEPTAEAILNRIQERYGWEGNEQFINDANAIGAGLAKVDSIAETNQRLKDMGYVPLSRFGQYYVDVKDASGKTQYFSLFESESEANKMARDLRGTFPEGQVTQGVMSQEEYKLFKGVSPDTMMLFADQIFLDSSVMMQSFLKLAVNNRSTLKRLIERKGTAGYSEDVVRGLANFLVSNARRASSNLHTGDIQKNAFAIRDGDVKDEAVKLAEYVQNPREEAAGLRGLLFLHFMGGSIASALVNLTQPFMQTLPFLGQHGGNAKAGKALASGMKTATQFAFGGQPKLEGQLGKDLQRAQEDGVVTPHEIFQLMAQAGGAGRGSKAGAHFSKLWGSFFAVSEAFNRYSTFIAAHKIAEENGFADPYKFAVNAVNETQGVYNKGNRPNWARGAVGATLFTFKQFSVSYLEFLQRLPKRQRILALTMLVGMSGLDGLPFAEDLEDIIDALAGKLGYSWQTKNEIERLTTSLLGRTASNFIDRGVSAALPFDIAGRMSMGNLIPGTGLINPGKADKAREALEPLGAVGGLAKAAGEVYQGNVVEGLPKAIKDVMKGAEVARTGELRDRYGKKIADAAPGDAFFKAIGLNPSTAAESSQNRMQVQSLINIQKAQKNEFAQRIAQAIVDQKPAERAAAMEDLKAWNRKNPDAPIAMDAATIARRVQEMKLSAEQRQDKRTPKEMRAYFRAQQQGEKDDSTD